MNRRSRRRGGQAPEYTGLPPPRKRARTDRAAQGSGQVQQNGQARQAPRASPEPEPVIHEDQRNPPAQQEDPNANALEVEEQPEVPVAGEVSPAARSQHTIEDLPEAGDQNPNEPEDEIARPEQQKPPEQTSEGGNATPDDMARRSSPAVSTTQETHQAAEQQDQEARTFISQATQTDLETSSANHIAHYEIVDEVPIKDKAGYLKTKVRIETDPTSQHRLAYNATFSVVTSPNPSENQENQEDEEEEEQEQEQEVGYLLSWRVDKPTSTHPAPETPWKDLLTLPVPRQPKSQRELAKCLQAIYDKKGVLRPDFHAHAAELTENSLLYIEMVFLDETVRGTGAFRSAMQGFEAALAGLPEWFAFAGTVILVPGMPIIHQDAWEGERDDAKIEDVLIGKYSKRGYEVWARKAEVRIRTGEVEEICVMGKTVHLGAGA
ncbi:hypothetical protein KC340_g15939 [Hortaea werneckii]|nr:hypothetical protein KC342_g15664 [Hortaea werneckii]KAI7110244.1 hypothetical protein KC339_g162 [Hortaea werneckii]KAI7225381.1 hypothetical protein KC365_g10018 [Hortaea werneckii]KAI7295027.1 hypothetical protein KC340_g15939 [Hortaea werneckii]KAI7381279.1 hypothetical protein KC328_g12334 [Hortaea werneckii]